MEGRWGDVGGAGRPLLEGREEQSWEASGGLAGWER